MKGGILNAIENMAFFSYILQAKEVVGVGENNANDGLSNGCSR